MIRAAFLLVLMPAPLAAQSTVTLPAGCTAYVTIQKRSCIVSHLFTCANDSEGHQRRVDYDEEGMVYMGRIDAETQWIESVHVRVDNVERLAPDPVDPASFTELLQTGTDTFDFRTLSDRYGDTRYRGYDRLTGKSVSIDGVPMEETEFEVTASDAAGAVLWRVEGREFIHRDWRSFLSGVRRVTTPDEAYETDGRPVDFAFPSEPGFLSSEPEIGCGDMISKGK